MHKKCFQLVFISLFVAQTAIFAQSKTPDLIVYNAKIRTLDERQPVGEAMAIVGNRISAVGTNKEIRRLSGAKTKIIDAEGKLVLPGFNDSHVHFMNIGNQFSSLNLRDSKTPHEIIEKLKFYAKFLPENRWILGGGWNYDDFTNGKLPNRKQIDDATPENPVFLYSTDAKSALVNESALKLAKINESSESSDFIRKEGNDSAIIVKNSPLNSIKKLIPRDFTKQWSEIAETVSNYAASLGITSVQDMSADNLLEIYRTLAREGKLKTRIYDCTNLLEWQKMEKIEVIKENNDFMVRGGCLKGFSDGDAKSFDKLYESIKPADKAGFQIMIHAIGGSANEIVLSVFERVAKENGSRDRRFRVEHAHNARQKDLTRFGKSYFIASMQPFLFFGGTRNNSEPYRTFLKTNVKLAFGSDAAITDFNPLLGIYAAVNEPSEDRTKISVNSIQTISVEQAVRAYTTGSAYAEFQENVKGTLSVGKLADFVILSDDIFTIDRKNIGKTKVLLTVMDGKVVYEAK